MNHHTTFDLRLTLLAKIWVLSAALLAGMHPAAAQTPTVPGVPEPGLILYGTVTNIATGQPVTITSVDWMVTNSLATGATTFALTGASRPATTITQKDGVTYYMVTIPFDTRTIGSGPGAVALADPAAAQPNTDSSEQYNSFELKTSSAPTYTLTPTINGLVANIKAVDGAPTSGTSRNESGFTTGTRGKVVRVDLTINIPLTPYETWAMSNFGNTTGTGAQSADPDGDGSTNYQEYTAGTNPSDRNSLFRVLVYSFTANGTVFNISWQSVAGKRYQLEQTTDLVAAGWTSVGTPITATTTPTSATAPVTPAPRVFFRVRIVP